MNFVKICILFFSFLGFSSQLQAQVNNGGFESNLTGWSISGAVEVLSSGNFTPAVGPFEGSSFALLSTGPQANGGGDTGNDIDGSGGNEYDAATLTQTFNASGSGTLKFTVAGFATAEVAAGVDDIFEVRIDGNPVIQGSVPGVGGSSFADFGVLDGIDYQVTSVGLTDGSRFRDGITASQQFSFNLSAGTHTLEFFIADEDDDIVDSGLLVDNVQFLSKATSVPTLSEWSLMILIFSLGFIAIIGAKHDRLY